MLNPQYFGHPMGRADSLQKTLMLGKTEDKRRRGQKRMRWLDSITESMDRNLSKLQEIVKDKGSWHAPVHGFTNSYIRLKLLSMQASFNTLTFLKVSNVSHKTTTKRLLTSL